jgi:hypothetical protein
MTKNSRMQQVMTRALVVMLVASFLLSTFSFAFPRIALADFWQECTCHKSSQCGGGDGWFCRWCGSNCSPPCGPWLLQACICP